MCDCTLVPDHQRAGLSLPVRARVACFLCAASAWHDATIDGSRLCLPVRARVGGPRGLAGPLAPGKGVRHG